MFVGNFDDFWKVLSDLNATFLAMASLSVRVFFRPRMIICRAKLDDPCCGLQHSFATVYLVIDRRMING